MTPFERRVRALVYAAFIDTGHAPDIRTLCGAAGASAADVSAALRRLAELHALVLEPDTARIWMAHPFSGRLTPFPVEARGRRYFANCAWDAAGVLTIVGDGRCATPCGDCGGEMTFSVDAGAIAGGGAVHFAVPARRFWDDIAFT
jgi:hypothetical protein